MHHHPQIEFQRREQGVCKRMLWVACGLILGFTGISTRLWWLQVRQHEKLATEAAELRKVRLPLTALRGSIMDRNGELLAQDRELHEFYIDKTHLADANYIRPSYAKVLKAQGQKLDPTQTPAQLVEAYRAYLIARLAPQVGMSERDLSQVLEPGGLASPVLLKDLQNQAARNIETFLCDNYLCVVYKRSKAERFRPADDRLIHVLGLVRHKQITKDGVELPRKGIDGVEQFMDSILNGVDGFEEVEKDIDRKRILPGYAGIVQPPQHGKHVLLTVDMRLQQMLEDELKAAYELNSPRKITGVLVEPATGSILAMASHPVVQELPNGDKERRNIAVTDVFEPGSTMKIITLSGALDQGVVSLQSEFFCHNGYYQESKDVWVRDDESNGTLSVRNILARSSNIGAYKVAKRLGEERFFEYINRFGLGSRALGLPRESAGIVRPLDKWNGGTSLSRIAMGYEVMVTPLQLAMVVSTIANQGVLMQPRLVDRIVTADRKHMEVVAPVVVRQACKASTAKKMVESLAAAVVEGTGKQAAVEGATVAGKTGTAQRYDANAKGKDKYPDGHFVVSFAGFAPVEKPRLACVIVIDDPKSSDHGQLYGGKLAAPVFSKVVGRAFQLMAIAPDRQNNISLLQDSQGGAQQ